VLFEAAARHLSFKRAAAELHVTPAAVSQQVRQLEAWLGQTRVPAADAGGGPESGGGSVVARHSARVCHAGRCRWRNVAAAIRSQPEVC